MKRVLVRRQGRDYISLSFAGYEAMACALHVARPVGLNQVYSSSFHAVIKT